MRLILAQVHLDDRRTFNRSAELGFMLIDSEETSLVKNYNLSGLPVEMSFFIALIFSRVYEAAN